MVFIASLHDLSLFFYHSGPNPSAPAVLPPFSLLHFWVKVLFGYYYLTLYFVPLLVPVV